MQPSTFGKKDAIVGSELGKGRGRRDPQQKKKPTSSRLRQRCSGAPQARPRSCDQSRPAAHPPVCTYARPLSRTHIRRSGRLEPPRWRKKWRVSHQTQLLPRRKRTKRQRFPVCPASPTIARPGDPLVWLTRDMARKLRASMDALSISLLWDVNLWICRHTSHVPRYLAVPMGAPSYNIHKGADPTRAEIGE